MSENVKMSWKSKWEKSETEMVSGSENGFESENGDKLKVLVIVKGKKRKRTSWNDKLKVRMEIKMKTKGQIESENQIESEWNWDWKLENWNSHFDPLSFLRLLLLLCWI